MVESQAMEIIRLEREQVGPVKSRILEIYREAFASPPYSRTEIDVESFSRTLDKHRERRDFRFFVARQRGTREVQGFTYGYTSAPGQWWHDLVEDEMTPPAIQEWLVDAFEFVELAVAPRAQGRGAGRDLHDALLSGLPHRVALLSTMQAETVALTLYRRRGWVTLLNGFYFPGTLKPYLIMGLKLWKRSL